MTQYTINLSSSDENALRQAASAANMTETAFVEKLVSDHFAAKSPPSWEGDLLLQVLRAVKATPAIPLDMNLLQNVWLKEHGATSLKALPAALSDLTSKGVMVPVGNKYQLTENGYEFIRH